MRRSDVFSAVTPAECQPDRPGDLSIVVQGGLSERNVFETANNVRHWRNLFPAAQIIVALSGTTIFEPKETEGELPDQRLAAKFAIDSQIRAALIAIQLGCNAVVMAGPAFPLPPIKSDTPLPNNINLQIAAARAGLARADGRYVLRVRSDLVFLDRGFLSQYSENAERLRGDAVILNRRVLISWIYTLNPFAEERLPLHFSDWFHFGLREDVVRLWDVPEMTLHDALFYRTHPYAPHSNAAERLFNTRLADEQHILDHALCRDGQGLCVRYHNDPEPAIKSLQLLADNFVLCDMKVAKCVFPKYGEEFHNHRKLTACITPDDWSALVTMRHVDPRIVLSGKIQQVYEPRHDSRLGFPRRFLASQLATEIGALSRGSIIAYGNGLAARGPLTRLPVGRYFAQLDVGPLEGEGALRVSVTTDDNTVVVAEVAFRAGTRSVDLVVPFQVTGCGAKDVKILCRSDGLDAVTIHGLLIDKANPEPVDRPFPWFTSLLPEHLACTIPITTSHQQQARTARMQIRPGCYVAAVNLPALADGDTMTLDAATNAGARVIATRCINDGAETGSCQQLHFDITEVGIEDLVLSCRGNTLPILEKIGIVIARRGWIGPAAPFPRFYDAQSLRVGNGEALVDRILSNGQDGVLCFGPYVELGAGRYTALVHMGGDMPKLLTVSITGEIGGRQLVTGRFGRRQLNDGAISVLFDIGPEGMKDVEVICRVYGRGKMFVTGVTLARADIGQ